MVNQEAEKLLAAQAAVSHVYDGMRVGLGSGSTSLVAVRLLGERVRHEGLKFIGVATSIATRRAAETAGIPLLEDRAGFELDLAIDGADQATRAGWLIKGGGGAMLHERIVAAAAQMFIVIADSTKLVAQLGGFPLPVEVCRLGWKNVQRRLATYGPARLRLDKQGAPFATDEGNYILDGDFPPDVLAGAPRLAIELRSIAGVVDHGLFIDMADRLIIGRGAGVEEISIARATSAP